MTGYLRRYAPELPGNERADAERNVVIRGRVPDLALGAREGSDQIDVKICSKGRHPAAYPVVPSSSICCVCAGLAG